MTKEWLVELVSSVYSESDFWDFCCILLSYGMIIFRKQCNPFKLNFSNIDYIPRLEVSESVTKWHNYYNFPKYLGGKFYVVKLSENYNRILFNKLGKFVYPLFPKHNA